MHSIAISISVINQESENGMKSNSMKAAWKKLPSASVFTFSKIRLNKSFRTKKGPKTAEKTKGPTEIWTRDLLITSQAL